MVQKEKKRKKILQKLINPYLVMIIDEESFEEQIQVRISRLKVFVLGFSVIALVYSRQYLIVHELLRNEYFILALMSILGMMIMISGHSLLTLYLGLEIMSLSLYSLIATARDRAFAIEAALKYFVLGALSSGILLYGCSLIYGFAGSTNFNEIQNICSHCSNLKRSVSKFIFPIGIPWSKIAFHSYII